MKCYDIRLQGIHLGTVYAPNIAGAKARAEIVFRDAWVASGFSRFEVYLRNI